MPEDYVTVDTKGMACPLPILKLRKVMRDVLPGTKVRVLGTGPGFVEDIRVFCAISGCALISIEDLSNGVTRVTISQAAP